MCVRSGDRQRPAGSPFSLHPRKNLKSAWTHQEELRRLAEVKSNLLHALFEVGDEAGEVGREPPVQDEDELAKELKAPLLCPGV